VSTLTLDLVTDAAALPALAAEWDALWRRCPGATPFQSPHWLLPWWRQFGTDAPRVALLRDGDALAALLPLYVLREGEAEKTLPIGVGVTDYIDALVAPDAPPDTVRRLLAAALGGTCCDLPDLAPDAVLRRADAPPGWRDEVVQGETCPVLVLGADCVPSRMRRKLRMNRHRADRAGSWRVERVAAEDFADALAVLIRLNGARWEEAGVFGDARVRAFHAEAGPRLLAAGLLRFVVLRLEGQIVAAVYALQDAGERIFLHLGGFDAAQAFISPGTLLLGALIEEAMAEGRRELHFLRGAESYKYAWGAQDRRNAMRSLRR
jgi:CelD/BcsL family acetyltransferase involved in cellulose biosynthesis